MAMRLGRPVAVLLLVAALCACSGAEKYDGKTLDEWIELAQGPAFGPAETVGEQRAEAFRELSKIGAPAVPALTKMLPNRNLLIGGGAVKALAAIGDPAVSAVPSLIEQLKTRDDTGVLQSIPAALAAIAPGSEEVQMALIDGMSNPDSMVRELAQQALMTCFASASAAPPAVEKLRAMRPARGNPELQVTIDNLLKATGG